MKNRKRNRSMKKIVLTERLREKRKQIENYDEKQKKKQEYEKNCPNRKLSSK
jgi:hypothetical protein